jgi:hypothetical protein
VRPWITPLRRALVRTRQPAGPSLPDEAEAAEFAPTVSPTGGQDIASDVKRGEAVYIYETKDAALPLLVPTGGPAAHRTP